MNGALFALFSLSLTSRNVCIKVGHIKFVTAKLQQTVSRNTPNDTVREEPNSNIKDSAENVNENTKSSFMWCEREHAQIFESRFFT